MSDTTQQPEPTETPDTLAIALEEEITRRNLVWAPLAGENLAGVVRELWQEGLIHAADLDRGAPATCWLCGQGISIDAEQRSDENGSCHVICLDAYWDAETQQIRAAFDRLNNATAKYDGVISSKPAIHPRLLRDEKDRLIRGVDNMTDDLLSRADDLHDRSRLGHDGPAGGQNPTS